jgi:hypothetical protein
MTDSSSVSKQVTEDIVDDFWRREGISSINPRETLGSIGKTSALIGYESEYHISDLMSFQVLYAARRHLWAISGQGSWLLRAADLSF